MLAAGNQATSSYVGSVTRTGLHVPILGEDVLLDPSRKDVEEGEPAITPQLLATCLATIGQLKQFLALSL